MVTERERLIQAMADSLNKVNVSERQKEIYKATLRHAIAYAVANVPIMESPSIVPDTKPLNNLARDCHATNQHWWHHPATGERLDRNKGELLMLIVTEIAEAMEGERKNLMDDKLPHRKMAEVELADALIRIFDYAGAFGFDLDGAVAEKRAFNATRADHKAEARLSANGKKW
jgi:NTP pyrophosphatase (non-canonical NTP hydrolase)